MGLSLMKNTAFYMILLVAFFFVACSNHSSNNLFYQEALKNAFCDESFFNDERKKVDKGDDVIYIGLNVGALARNCSDFKQSNYFFDKAEESYKYDVDLQGFAKKGAKTLSATLINDNINDYEGTLYERIMVNVYKGLNFMSLNDFANARVEFNRALMRQEKAKEYFAKEIEANRKEFDEAKKDENYQKNMDVNFQNVSAQYNHLLKEFSTTTDFINPYATYIASVFFFLDEDYRRAADLFREVAITNMQSAEFKKEFAIFNQYANSTNPSALKKYIFVVYEGGLGAGLKEFAISVPFIFDDTIIHSSLSLPILEKRESSFAYLLANGARTADFVDFDNIIATEFKVNSPFIIGKALSSMIVKTSLSVAVANNDPTGGFLAILTDIFNTATTTADLRFWNSLPKYAKIVMIENTGSVSITNDTGGVLYQNNKLAQNKNVLIVVKSFTRMSPSVVWLIQK